MGLDVIELMFWWVGKIFWRHLSKMFGKSITLSDGTYEVIGLAICILFGFLVFAYWSL